MIEIVVWIQCLSDGTPIFATASQSKLESRSLLRQLLYSGEDMSWAEIREEGSIEKQFKVIEIPEKEANAKGDN